MSIEKTCCNCLHCARWKTSEGIKCHCDLDDRYLGYVIVMSKIGCKNWEAFEKGSERMMRFDEQKREQYFEITATKLVKAGFFKTKKEALKSVRELALEKKDRKEQK